MYCKDKTVLRTKKFKNYFNHNRIECLPYVRSSIDQIGNLTTDSQSAATISWDVYQKIRKVERAITLGGGGLYIQTERFFYDAMDERTIFAESEMKHDNASSE